MVAGKFHPFHLGHKHLMDEDITGLRDQTARSAMHTAYEAMLASGRKRFTHVSGNRASRTAQAADAVRELLARAIVLAG